MSLSLSETDMEIAKNDTREPYLVIALKELRWVASASFLTAFALVLQWSLYFVNVISIGHLGTNELAGTTLSIFLLGVIANAPTHGILSATETFCSTAYTASRDKTLVGFHLQRGLIAVTIHNIAVAPILWKIEPLLLAIGQEPEVAKFAGIYMRNLLITVPAFTGFEACKRYLQAQGIMRANTVVLILVVPFHCVINYLLVRSPTYGIGFVGAPISTVISEWVMFAGIVIYIRNSRAMDTWGGWDIRAFRNMFVFYRFAMSGVITICTEWIAFDLLNIGASYFGAAHLAASAIALNTLGIISYIGAGLGFGTSPRIGNLIGAAKPRQARIAGNVAVALSLFAGMMCTTFLIVFSDWWISVYTADPEVASKVKNLLSIACVFTTFHGLKSVLNAIMRGLGRQKMSATINTLAYQICAVPLGAYLAFIADMKSSGLWWGICIGIMILCCLQIIYIYTLIDWKNEVRLCIIRLQKNSADANEEPDQE
ncbi:ethionine resistance protein [Coemansia sp. RSA 1365]|nr:ethionine resistance protein [Coemansia sp. RSA 1365]